jgi:HMW1C N-terminal/HMW1 domain 2
MPPSRQNPPSVYALEKAIAGGNHRKALDLVHAILGTIDRRFGRLDGLDLGPLANEPSTEERTLTFATRFVAAFGALVSDPDLKLPVGDYERLLLQHRWIDLLCGVSGFRSSDFLLAKIATERAGGEWTFSGDSVLRLLAAYSLNSRHGLDFAQCWKINRTASAVAFLHYVGSRYLFWPNAFDLRERLLEWLPARLDQVKLGSMTLSRIPEIYMHCSYAITPRKHEIKTNIMRQMHRACVEAGCVEMPGDRVPSDAAKPTAIVIAEHLKPDHSVFRTHSKTVLAMRKDFHLVGVVYPDPQGTPIEDMFDEVLALPRQSFLESIRVLSVEIRKRNPDLVYFTGVGMIPYMIALGALRMAPVQCVSFGHTATTMSPAIDYFLLPEDFVGSKEVYSEKVLGLPRAAMPFARREVTMNRNVERAGDGVVRVAIPAATMKLNPRFFAALTEISKRAKSPVEFHFLPLGSAGLVFAELSRAVRVQVPGSVVHTEMPFESYLGELGKCDLFVSPFPYGNMNSIMDAMNFYLPGVCLDGDEAHSHADVAIFNRIGFPAELCAKTVEDYVAATVKLIDDPEWRKTCENAARACDFDEAFFTGDASLFSKAMLELIGKGAPGPEAKPAKARRPSKVAG